ncbi:tubulin-like doman-containing protein [Parabacteroides sp. OttesenSCG-928-B22]|nr:tubulin-like doman-containing protein [Parabacteroides sp. OttesenSCG-928-B22]
MADILIGLGGTGGKILKAFRQRLWTEYNSDNRRQLPIGFIYVDTDNSMLSPSDVSYETIHGNCCFEENEFVDIKTNSNIDEIFNNSQSFPRLQGVLGNVTETQTAVCPIGAAADQKRRAGRILFGANIDAYLSKLNSSVEAIRRREVGGEITVTIFAGLAGGTGSGSIIDTIAQTRKWFFEHGFNETQFKITVFAQLPENTPPANWNTGSYKANGYGALLELNNLFTAINNREWGEKAHKAPYDVSTNVDYGRLYLTYDNPTAENVRNGSIPQGLKIAGGLILYSNKNDFGHTITDPVELASLVADFVYTKIFYLRGQQTHALNRFYTFENLTRFREEFDEKADPELEAPIPVRTRAVGSFGIKRVVVPETAMQEHITYTLGYRILLQLKYNNWSNSAGYQDSAANFDYFTYVSDEGRLNNWSLSNEHLFLKKHILPGDVNEGWSEGEFNTYWDACIDQWAAFAKGASDPFAKLIEMCRGGYAEGFRTTGVDAFFSGKARSIHEAYAKQIALKVETELFDAWDKGKLPLVSLTKIVEELCSVTRERANNFAEVLLPELNNACREKESQIESTVTEYLQAGLLKRPVIFGNRYERVVLLAKQLYRMKTDMAACRVFAQPLTEALVKLFSDLKTRIESFTQQVDELLQYSKERMVVLADAQTEADTNAQTEIDGTEDMAQPIIRFYNRTKLLDLENKLRTDKRKMDDINEAVRTSIVKGLQSEGRFLHIDKLNKQFLSQILLNTVYSKILTYHEELCPEPKEKILGVSILDRLRQRFGGREDELRKFAKDLMVSSGVFTEIDRNEIDKSFDNTVPPEKGKNILLKTILVCLPRTEDPELLAFADNLKDKLIGAIPGGEGAAVSVSTEGTNKNEITVMSIVNGFPMRAIAATAMLKAEYDRQIAQDPKNKIVLLGEGKEGDFDSIFASSAKTPESIREEFAPYLILCLALGKVMLDQDNTGEYGDASVDFFGNPSISPWGKTVFTEIPFDDRLMKEKHRSLKKMYVEGMADACQSLETMRDIEAKKKELQTALMAAIAPIIQTEKPARAQYACFETWTKEAVKILLSYKPEV